MIPTPPDRLPIRMRRRLPQALSAALLILAAGGCEQRSSAAEALAQSQRELTTLGLSGSLTASESRREKVYKDVLVRLQPVAQSGLDWQKDSASALLARAHAGIGELHCARAVAASGEAMRQARLITALLDRRDGHTSLVGALSAYDPAPDSQSFRSLAAERRTELSELQTRVDSIAAEIAKLEGELSGFAKQAEALRAEEGALRAQALDAEPSERIAIIERAVERQRAADDAEGRAAEVRARIARHAPELEAARTVVARAERQLAFLADAEKQVAALAAADREQADANRSAADEAAKELGEQVSALNEAVTKQVEPEFEASIKALEGALRAASAVKGAGPADRTSTQLDKARIQQSLAGAHRARAITLSMHADVLNDLARAQPPLAGVNELQSVAAASRSAADAAFAAAAEAYGHSVEALSSAGGRGDLADRLQQIAKEIESVRASLPGAAPAAPKESGPSKHSAEPGEQRGESGNEIAPPAEGEQPAADEATESTDQPAEPPAEGEPAPTPGDQEVPPEAESAR